MAAGLAAVCGGDVRERHAAAHGDVDVDRPTVESRAGTGGGRPSGAAAETGETQAEHEDRYHARARSACSAGARSPSPCRTCRPPASPAITYSRSDQTPVRRPVVHPRRRRPRWPSTSESSVRLPFTFATFSPSGSASRSTDVASATSSSRASTRVPVAHGPSPRRALGVALPTAQGTEIPVGLSEQSAGTRPSTGAYDRWSLEPGRRVRPRLRGQRALRAAAPRHHPEDRPRATRVHGAQHRAVREGGEPRSGPRARSTRATSASSWAALRVGYWVHREFELALKGWVNVGFAGTSDDKTTAAALEPQVVLRFGSVRPYAGVILPLAGPPSDNGFIGVRSASQARF